MTSSPSNPQHVGIQMWPNVLSSLTDQESWENDQISRFLVTIQDEIADLNDELRERGVPETLFANYLTNMRSSVDPMRQKDNWQSLLKAFDKPRTDCLQWASLYLGDEEEEISREEMEDLVSAIEKLKNLISTGQIPGPLRRSMQKHIANMEDAIADYPIRGVGSIRTALEASTGILHSSKDAYKSAMQTDQGRDIIGSAREMLEKAGGLIDAAGKKADAIGKIGSALGAAFKLLS